MIARRRRIDRYSLLRQTSLFSGCTKRELGRIDSLTTMVEVDQGRVLTREGRPGIEFFVVARGTATGSRHGVWIAEFEPGSFFGELALLGDGLRTATIVADTDMSLLVSSRAEFWSLYDSVPRISQTMSTELKTRHRNRDQFPGWEPSAGRSRRPVVFPALEG